MIYELIIQNKEILKVPYGFMICLICAIIFFRTDRLFKISSHQGIRYFRNAFLFFSLAFLIRYVMGSPLLLPFAHENFFFIIKGALEFFFIMAGFFLLYSLIWKNIETPGSHFISSLFNPIILLFYLMTFLILAVDYIWQTYLLMFLSQIIVFVIASAISFNNYLNSPGGFPKFYFLAMILSLTTWILNAIAALFEWNQILIINISIINIIIFLLFLFGVIKFTKGV